MNRPRALPAAPRSAGVSLLALAALVAGPARSEIVTPNTNDNSVLVHAVTADGDVAPLAKITGSNTGINQPFGVAVDPVHGEIFVASFFDHSIRVFRAWDNGNAIPLRTIAGAATLLNLPIGIVYDAVNDEIVLRNLGSATNQVLAFSRTGDGNVAPLRALGGNLTEIDGESVDLAVDAVNDELFVSSRDTDGSLDAVLAFARTATGNTAPIRKIQGATTTLTQPYGIAVDTVNDELLVADAAGSSRVVVFARTATGNVAPIRQLSPSPAIAAMTGIDLDLVRGEIVVASQSQGRLAAFSRTASGTTAPLRTIAGPATGLASPGLLTLNSAAIFGDGFESGDTSAWSLTVP